MTPCVAGASGMLELKTARYRLARIVYALAIKGGHYDDRPSRPEEPNSARTRFRRKAIRIEGEGEAM
jgi:hypothetical protein